MSWREAALLGEVRVLDLCRVVSGPFAFITLARLLHLHHVGAEITELHRCLSPASRNVA